MYTLLSSWSFVFPIFMFHLLKSGGEFEVESPSCGCKNSPSALSVKFYELRIVGFTFYLHLHNHSIPNMLVCTVCNISTCQKV
jgi:hypothetical protein